MSAAVRPASARPRRASSQRRRRRGQLSDIRILRYVPSTSPFHRVWAGTQIVAIVALTIGLLLWPSWAAGGLALAAILAALLVARLPRGTAPRIPRVVWLFILVGAAIALVAGGKPHVHLGGVAIGVGGLEIWARFALIGIDLLLFAAVMSWTTPLADLAPALARLTGPLRHLKVPIDEIVGAIALAVRCLPLLIDEVRMLLAARRTRRPVPPTGAQARLELLEEMWMAALHSSLRRARELAEAIEARGGSPTAFVEPVRLGAPDYTCLVVVAAAIAGMALLR